MSLEQCVWKSITTNLKSTTREAVINNPEHPLYRCYRFCLGIKGCDFYRPDNIAVTLIHDSAYNCNED